MGEANDSLPFFDVGFVLADDLVSQLLARVFVGQVDGCTEDDAPMRLGAGLGNVDDLGRAELALNLGDTALVEALLFLGRVVFRVFLEIAMRTRFLDGRDDSRTFGLLQPCQLVAQRVSAGLRQWRAIHETTSKGYE